jgi:PKD repeat protein
MVLFAWQDASNYRVVDCRDGANKWFIREYIGGSRYNRAVTEEIINTNQQYHLEVVIAPSGLVTLYVDSVEKVSYNFGSVITGPVGLALENSHSQFDNFCTTSEPPPPPPVAEFVGSPTSGCAPLTVDFTDQSTGEITSWDWTFGDGGTSTAQSPSHQYTSGGDYTVSLTVSGPNGSDTETKTGYIHVDEAPVAEFVGSPLTGTEPLTVDFTDQSTGNPTSWSWDFGDGGTSTEQNPAYTYTTAGTYTVELTATNACGSDTETKTDYITVDPCIAPTAEFVGSPTAGDAPLTVDFTDQSTGNPTSWDWDFGDGGTSTAQNPSHTYTMAGTYTVALTATNTCGSDTETKVDYITVTEPSVNEMHVHNIVVTKSSFWWFSRGIATVTIYDQGGSPVPSATVYGSFSGPLSQNMSGSTNASGQVTFTSSWSSGSGEWCFEVTNVVKTDWTYNPAANVMTKACESGPAYRAEEPLLTSETIGPQGSYRLENCPDPFSRTTAIIFELPEPSQVRLEVYSITGQRVAILADRVYTNGVHMVTWDASGIASGVYFYRMTAGEFIQTNKMLLTK